MRAAPYQAIHAAIEQHWSLQWSSAGVPTRYMGGPNVAPNATGEYVILSHQFGGADPLTVGRDSALAREAGMVFVQVIVPDGIGARRAWEIAEQAAAVWTGPENDWLQIDIDEQTALMFAQPHVIQAGMREGYLQLNVQASFEFTY